AHDEEITSVRDVYEVAGVAIGPVVNHIVHQLRPHRTRLDVMALMRSEELASFDSQLGHMIDVDSVGAGGDAVAVALEITVADDDRASGGIVAENAVFVADEAAVLDCKVSSFGANAGAVVVPALGALD